MENSPLIPLYRKLAAACVPAKVRIELTRRCNLKCVHCKVVTDPAPEGELTADDLRKILPQLQQAGTFEINLTGGEIFSRPDILEVLSVILEHNFLIFIQTNGTLLRDEHFRFLESNRKKITMLGVSLYAADRAVHEAVTGVKGSYDRTMKTISTLKEMDFPFSVFTLLMSINMKHHEETSRFLDERGIVHQFGGLMIAREDGCMDPLEYRVSDDDLKDLPIPWEKYLNPEPESAPTSYDSTTPISEWCIAARFCAILPNGDLIPCAVIRTPAGNLKKQSFEEIWNESEMLKHLRTLTVGDLECASCEYFPRCRPCIGLAFAEHGSFTARPSDYCRLTKMYLKKH